MRRACDAPAAPDIDRYGSIARRARPSPSRRAYKVGTWRSSLPAMWLSVLALLLPLPPVVDAGGSTLEELCDCNQPTAYGFKCACGDPSKDPSIKGCCNIGKGSCTDFCNAKLIDQVVDQNDIVALRAEIERLKQMLKARPPPPAAPVSSASASASASDLADPQQQRADALERAFQTRAISLGQYEIAAAALSAEITASTPPSTGGIAAEERDCAAALSCEDCRKLSCAWCIGGRKCVEDKPWICAGDTDHIGKIGKVKQCPAAEELEQLFIARREREAEAAAELERLRASAESCEANQQGDSSCNDHGVDPDGREADETPEEANRRHAEDLRKRVENAATGKGGKDQPYAVLGVPPEATQGEIRKAYRKLSLRFHPDKNDGSVDAQTAFADIVDAYEILGDPEVRMAFDEYGGLDPEAESFDSFAQYMDSGSKKAPDFYTGERTITALNEKYWERRLSGESIWLVEFYAPWCSACQRFSKGYKEVAKLLEEDEIETGAVNCQTESNLCAERFAIRSYPTIRLINRERGTQQEYHNSNSLEPDVIVAWAREIAEEWRWLFTSASLPSLTPATFNATVLEDDSNLWLVLFTDGTECGPCKTAQTNMLRLSAGLADTAAKVGMIDCEPPDMRTYCTGVHGMPEGPHAPQIKAWRRGKKGALNPGEVLYNANEVEPHLALELTERLIRLALESSSMDESAEDDEEIELDENGLAIPKKKIEFERDGANAPPPPPPPPFRPRPHWNGPKRPDPLPWDGSARPRNMKALGG